MKGMDDMILDEAVIELTLIALIIIGFVVWLIKSLPVGDNAGEMCNPNRRL